MRRLGGSLLLGLSAATFFLIPVVEPLLRLSPARSYFLARVPERLDYLVLLGLILLIGLLAGSSDYFGQQYSGAIRRLLEGPLWILCALGIEHVIHRHLGRSPPWLWNTVGAAWNHIGITVTNGWFITGLLCAIPVLLGFSLWPRAWSSAKPILCGGAAALWLACGLNAIQPPIPLPDTHSFVERDPARPVGHDFGPGSPIVWIILDEWDFDQTFNRKDRTVFPAIERLRTHSMFFEKVRAAGNATLTAIPSLLMGRAIKEYRTSSPSGARAIVTSTLSEHFPGPPTIFDTASQFGYRSHIVGWYHPYCRLFSGQVDTCWWDDMRMESLRPGQPVAARAGAFLRESIELELAPLGPTNLLIRQQARVEKMIDRASAAAIHPGRSFSFLHLPIPHGPFFRTGPDGQLIPQPNDVNGYQSGLEHADQAIAAIRAAMERAGVWEDALVVVSSDHPYRYQFEGGYGNGHIPLMIKFPHQAAPVVYSHPFQAVETKSLIEDFMQGAIPTPERALAWLERNGSSGPASGASVPASPVSMSMRRRH